MENSQGRLLSGFRQRRGVKNGNRRPAPQARRGHPRRVYPSGADDTGEKCRRRDRAGGDQPGTCIQRVFPEKPV